MLRKVEPLDAARGASGVFRDYVRSVLADHSERARALRARRMRWLRRVGQHATTSEQRWENEGGNNMW